MNNHRVSFNALEAHPCDAALDIVRFDYHIIDLLDCGSAEIRAGMSLSDSVTVMSVKALEYPSTTPKPEGAQSRVSEATFTVKYFEGSARKLKTSREGKPLENLAVPCCRQLR